MVKSVEHDLKCLAPYFDALERGDKTFEVRFNDRGYQIGDTLLLRKYEVERGYLGPVLRYTVTWMLTGGQFGIEPGFVVMALGEKIAR